MDVYERLLDECQNENLEVKEKYFISEAKGLIRDKKILINRAMQSKIEKACVLAEELGHHHTTTGNTLDLSTATNRKRERKARLWAYNKQVGLLGIINAFKHGCRNLFEMAELLNVTEEFLIEAINVYRSRYGIYTKLDNYIVYFEPNLGVMETYE